MMLVGNEDRWPAQDQRSRNAPAELMMAVPGAVRWNGRVLQQLWRNSADEEWRDVPCDGEEP